MSTETHPETNQEATDVQSNSNRDLGQELRDQTVAVKLSISRLGVSRKLNAEQRSRQAETFNADPEYIRGTKRLLNTRQEQYRAVQSIPNAARGYWRERSVPYPEKGIRLMHRAHVDEFVQQMESHREALERAVAELSAVYHEKVVEEARKRLGDLFDARDYPDSLEGCWSIDWEFPSVEPPNYLKQLNPKLYEEQRRRIAARFDEAVQLAEQELAQQFAQVVEHLVEVLSPAEVQVLRYDGPTDDELLAQLEANKESRFAAAESKQDAILVELGIEHDDLILQRQLANAEAIELHKVNAGKAYSLKLEAYPDEKLPMENGKDRKRASRQFPVEDLEDRMAALNLSVVRTKQVAKTFKDTSVENLHSFFERFRSLSIGQNQELDRLVERASQVVGDTSPSALRKLKQDGRDNLREAMAPIAETIDRMIVDRPRRGILLDDD